MIVKNNIGYTLNTEKPWEIEWCCRHQEFLDQTPYWQHWKSYKTFDAVVDAYCALQSYPHRLKGIQKSYYRINKIDFTGYAKQGK